MTDIDAIIVVNIKDKAYKEPVQAEYEQKKIHYNSKYFEGDRKGMLFMLLITYTLGNI